MPFQGTVTSVWSWCQSLISSRSSHLQQVIWIHSHQSRQQQVLHRVWTPDYLPFNKQNELGRVLDTAETTISTSTHHSFSLQQIVCSIIAGWKHFLCVRLFAPAGGASELWAASAVVRSDSWDQNNPIHQENQRNQHEGDSWPSNNNYSCTTSYR